MSAKCEEFIRQLGSLEDVDTDDSLELRLGELIELIEDDPDCSSVISHIFAFYEAHPDADFGTTGSFVHFLESHPDYEGPLLESVARKPTLQTVLMINRMLNSKITPEKRATLVGLLRSVTENPMADEVAREQAQSFLDRQARRSRQ